MLYDQDTLISSEIRVSVFVAEIGRCYELGGSARNAAIPIERGLKQAPPISPQPRRALGSFFLDSLRRPCASILLGGVVKAREPLFFEILSGAVPRVSRLSGLRDVGDHGRG